MKKIIGFACLFLAFAVGFGVVGGIMINRADVSMSDLYSIAESSISLIERTVTIDTEEEKDLSSVSGMSQESYVSYQLNEFNTVCLYAHDCTVNFTVDESESFSAVLSSLRGNVTMQSAVAGGYLYIKLVSDGGETASAADTALNIHIPTGYKGGFEIYGTDCIMNLGDIDSAMDAAFNLSDCTVSIDSLNAGEIDFQINGGSITASDVTATETVSVKTLSSSVSISGMEAVRATVKADSSSLYVYDIAGGFSAEEYLCSSVYDFAEISGNISISSKLCRTQLSVPGGAEFSLHHSERFSSFTDSTGSSESTAEDAAYSVDTNAEYSTVEINRR